MVQAEYWVNGDGSTQTFNLPSAPYGPVQVYYNGVLLPPSNSSVSGKAVTVSGFTPTDTDQMGFLYFPAPLPPAPSGGGSGGGSALINVSEVVNDPDFAQPFTILRSVGSFIRGVWTSVVTEIQGYGVIANPTNRELEMVPEGDRAKGAMVFWSVAPIYGTHETSGVGGSSDIIIWRSHQFRVLPVKQFQDYGYFRAIGVRLKAD